MAVIQKGGRDAIARCRVAEAGRVRRRRRGIVERRVAGAASPPNVSNRPERAAQKPFSGYYPGACLLVSLLIHVSMEETSPVGA
ncbi:MULTISPECIES: hypothetical protein [Frankia]|uniref:Uncharacterized protein n=1 Tax=Frankia alni (strain DSM 45986 / CECT 9034 / ACN14a) TaxID=326424 RepID=Q0RR23_FRAAA|nr:MULTISPECIES: hypothetical protein [Frankia]CAJ60000.1 hypothetical protein FRAAL1340 [Frankia alni ACN14a]